MTDANALRQQILDGTAPDGLSYPGHLSLANTDIERLPDNLSVRSLDLRHCAALTALPDTLNVRRLDISHTAIRELPAGLRVYELIAQDTPLKKLPHDLVVEYQLDLTNCRHLTELPPNLMVGALILHNCRRLRRLPDGLEVFHLDITDCRNLERFGKTGKIAVGRIDAENCQRLREIPAWVESVSTLNLRGCERITDLPEGLRVAAWVEIADTSLTRLPHSLRETQIRWRGIPITRRIAFQADTLTAEEVMQQPNIELRRVMLERMGYQRFIEGSNAVELDHDYDPGGVRRLLRINIPGDEPLVVVSFQCPSTGRQYVTRVPPDMETCHQAVAWMAGFDDPSLYRPIQET